MARERRGTGFDPDLVDAFLDLSRKSGLWESLDEPSVQPVVLDLRPGAAFDRVSVDQTDRLCEALADFADFKSLGSAGHSRLVAEAADGIASRLGLDEETRLSIRRAGHVHDVGKVAVPVRILQRQLTETELDSFRRHTSYTERILRRVAPLGPLANLAGADHEWVNGHGYPRQLVGEQIPLEVGFSLLPTPMASLGKIIQGTRTP